MDLLARFKLDAKADDFAGSLSGGQRKLLEMARALMVNPELVMLDEPMAGVNPALKQSLLQHVKSLREEGMTVLFVEHDMDMVRDISDWVVVMAQGQVIAEGPPDSVMGDQRVIDAYLGAHHDTDITEIDAAALAAEAEAELEGRREARMSDESETYESDLDALENEAVVPTDAAAEERAAKAREAHLAASRRRRAARRQPDRRLRARGQHPQRLPTSTASPASWSASSAPTAPASPPCSRRSSAWSRCTPAPSSCAATTSPTSGPTPWSPRASASCPQTNNVFPSLTIAENLRMGCYQAPSKFSARFDFVTSHLPCPGHPARPARGLALRR